MREANRVAQQAVLQAQSTDANIADLAKAASRIDDVVKLITAVAERTDSGPKALRRLHPPASSRLIRFGSLRQPHWPMVNP